MAEQTGQSLTQQVNYSSNSKNYSFLLFDQMHDINKLGASERKDKKESMALSTALLKELVAPFAGEGELNRIKEKRLKQYKHIKNKEIKQYATILATYGASIQVLQNNNIIPAPIYVPVLVHDDPDEPSGKTKAKEYIESLHQLINEDETK